VIFHYLQFTPPGMVTPPGKWCSHHPWKCSKNL